MLALDLQSTGGKFGWQLRRGRQIVARSVRGYLNKRSLRLSLVKLIQDIQRNDFMVYDDAAPRHNRRGK